MKVYGFESMLFSPSHRGRGLKSRQKQITPNPINYKTVTYKKLWVTLNLRLYIAKNKQFIVKLVTYKCNFIKVYTLFNFYT